MSDINTDSDVDKVTKSSSVIDPFPTLDFNDTISVSRNENNALTRNTNQSANAHIKRNKKGVPNNEVFVSTKESSMLTHETHNRKSKFILKNCKYL